MVYRFATGQIQSASFAITSVGAAAPVKINQVFQLSGQFGLFSSQPAQGCFNANQKFIKLHKSEFVLLLQVQKRDGLFRNEINDFLQSAELAVEQLIPLFRSLFVLFNLGFETGESLFAFPGILFRLRFETGESLFAFPGILFRLCFETGESLFTLPRILLDQSFVRLPLLHQRSEDFSHFSKTHF